MRMNIVENGLCRGARDNLLPLPWNILSLCYVDNVMQIRDFFFKKIESKRYVRADQTWRYEVSGTINHRSVDIWENKLYKYVLRREMNRRYQLVKDLRSAVSFSKAGYLSSHFGLWKIKVR